MQFINLATAVKCAKVVCAFFAAFKIFSIFTSVLVRLSVEKRLLHSSVNFCHELKKIFSIVTCLNLNLTAVMRANRELNLCNMTREEENGSLHLKKLSSSSHKLILVLLFSETGLRHIQPLHKVNRNFA